MPLTLPDIVEVDLGKEGVHADRLVRQSVGSTAQQASDQAGGRLRDVDVRRELQVLLQVVGRQT